MFDGVCVCLFMQVFVLLLYLWHNDGNDDAHKRTAFVLLRFLTPIFGAAQFSKPENIRFRASKNNKKKAKTKTVSSLKRQKQQQEQHQQQVQWQQ